MAVELRGVLDTNVVLAAQLNPAGSSPTAEILVRWQRREFVVLYSIDILAEYTEKLLSKGVPPATAGRFIRLLARHAELIPISFFHFRHYPVDPDDVMFLLCALNGRGTHLVTYDSHLLSLRPFYAATGLVICGPTEFLAECRRVVSSPQ